MASQISREKKSHLRQSSQAYTNAAIDPDKSASFPCRISRLAEVVSLLRPLHPLLACRPARRRSRVCFGNNGFTAFAFFWQGNGACVCVCASFPCSQDPFAALHCLGQRSSYSPSFFSPPIPGKFAPLPLLPNCSLAALLDSAAHFFFFFFFFKRESYFWGVLLVPYFNLGVQPCGVAHFHCRSAK